MIRRLAAMAILGFAILGLSFGCSPPVSKVEIKVTLDGAPLDNATVTFMSDTSSQICNGITDANGVAKMMTGAKEGVPNGSYKVSITKSSTAGASTGNPTEDMKNAMKENGGMPGAGPKSPTGPPGGGPGGPTAPPPSMKFKAMVPGKYGDPKTSGLTYTSPDDSKSIKEFNLSSSGK